MSIRHALTVVVFCIVGVFANAANASPVPYTFDTSLLVAPGTYSLDFQLTSSESPTGNSATLTNFLFGGGSVLGTSFYPPNGGVAGSVGAPPLVLTVTDSFNSVTQDFTPGLSLSFTLDLTNLAPAGLIPDQFSFAILRNGVEVATSDVLGANKLLRADLAGDQAGPVVSQYAAAPEPATLVLFAVGLLGAAAIARRRARIDA